MEVEQSMKAVCPDPFMAPSINCGGRAGADEEVWERCIGLFGKASN